MSLVLLLFLLLVLGTAPPRLFESNAPTPPPRVDCLTGEHMDPLISSPDQTDLEARRMELRARSGLASEVIAQYWPMRTFVHHNPLHTV